MSATYTTARAAQIAGVSRPTISAALKSGDLRGTMNNKGRWSISEPDLRDWMGRRVERAAPDPVPVPAPSPEPAAELVARIAAAEAAAAAAEARALIAEGRAQEASEAARRAGDSAAEALARAVVAEAARDAAAAEIERIRARGLWDRILNRT